MVRMRLVFLNSMLRKRELRCEDWGIDSKLESVGLIQRRKFLFRLVQLLYVEI